MGKLGWDGDGLVEFVGVDVSVCLGRGCGLRIQSERARGGYSPVTKRWSHCARNTTNDEHDKKKKGGAVHRGAVAMRRAFSGSGRLNRLVTRSGGSPGYFVLSCASLRARMGCGPFQPGCRYKRLKKA